MRYWLVWMGLMGLSGLAGLVSPSTQAQDVNTQKHFKRTLADGEIRYQYEWLDQSSNTQQVTFTLDQALLRDLPRQQTNYKPRLAMRYVKSELLKHAKTVDPRQARVSIQQQGENVRVGVKSNDKALIQQLNADFAMKQDSAFTQYLDDNYYHLFNDARGKEMIKPDHPRYVEAYTTALIPASQAFYEKLGRGSDARDYVNLLLGWIQSIPYNELQDRISSNGSGFAPPVTLLDSNVGDCDSKSVLAAAMIRAFLPQVPIRLIILPDHALLGVAISQRRNDEVLSDNGLKLVLMEPTGPAPLMFGEIAPSSRAQLARNLYVIETIP